MPPEMARLYLAIWALQKAIKFWLSAARKINT